jgi:hypothetical protein
MAWLGRHSSRRWSTLSGDYAGSPRTRRLGASYVVVRRRGHCRRHGRAARLSWRWERCAMRPFLGRDGRFAVTKRRSRYMRQNARPRLEHPIAWRAIAERLMTSIRPSCTRALARAIVLATARSSSRPSPSFRSQRSTSGCSPRPRRQRGQPVRELGRHPCTRAGDFGRARLPVQSGLWPRHQR